MFEPVTKAKLSGREFATICRVSFPAACNWMAGRTKPHALLQPKIDKAIRLIDALRKKQKLPLPDGLSHQERKEKIEKIGLLLETFKG